MFEVLLANLAKLKTMMQGKVAVVCLAGDTWVHSDEDIPVGMLDIGLPSGKTLFQLQAERLRRIQAMAQRMQEGSCKTRSAAAIIEGAKYLSEYAKKKVGEDVLFLLVNFILKAWQSLLGASLKQAIQAAQLSV